LADDDPGDAEILSMLLLFLNEKIAAAVNFSKSS
jgi:hypothetical protein